jgi:NADH-quinone oxidoreductase subunit N
VIASLLTQARDVPTIRTPSVDWLAVSPEIALAGAAVAIVLLRSVVRRAPWVYPASLVLSFSGVTAAAALLVRQWREVQDHGPITTIAGMLRVDGFGVFLGGVVVAATVLALLLSVSYIERERLEGAEYLALVLLSATGMLAMTTANDLIIVFLALEILSIPLYVLAAFDRRRLASQEAGIKYFVLGAFSSAVFLYGVALVYGATGTTSLTGISRFLSANTLLDEGVLLIGLGLLMVGLGFKVAAVPFHMWTPDVYQGAPTPVTAFMSSATKVAGFAALLRVFQVSFPLFRNDWRPAVGALAILSLAVGSVVAVVQNDVKRMLAYSSIAHAGYILVGFAAAAVANPGASARGLQSALFYLLVYAFMTIGAFAVVTMIARSSHDARHTLSEYRGLASKRPGLAALLAFFLLAQAGVPFTGGFVAKLEVFAAAVDARQYYLAIAGVVAAVVAAFFYLRVVVTMYTSAEEPAEVEAPAGRPRLRVDPPAAAVLAVTAALTLMLGILPGAFLDLAGDATFLLR